MHIRIKIRAYNPANQKYADLLAAILNYQNRKLRVKDMLQQQIQWVINSMFNMERPG